MMEYWNHEETQENGEWKKLKTKDQRLKTKESRCKNFRT